MSKSIHEYESPAQTLKRKTTKNVKSITLPQEGKEMGINKTYSCDLLA